MVRAAPRLNHLQKAAWIKLIVGALLAVLIFGGGFLIPIVIAGLLTSLTNSAIVKLEHVGLPTWLASLVSMYDGDTHRQSKAGGYLGSLKDTPGTQYS